MTNRASDHVTPDLRNNSDGNLQNEAERTRDNAPSLNAPVMSLLGLCIGIVGGIGAFLFRELIGLVHNVLFLHKVAFAYDSSRFTPASPWGPLVILVPVVGALAVTFLVENFAPEAKGHGVPEVMDAIYHRSGVIRPVVALVKSLASAIAIGSGSAVGREGPIIQIGSSFGSTLGQLIHMSQAQRITLIAAGAGAGIAATFNTPIGGVLFAIELMLPEISINTFLPLAIATGTATFVGRLFFGPQPAFRVPPILPLPADPWHGAMVLILYVVLGALTGIAAAGFVRGLHMVEDAFEKIPGRYLRHITGMSLVGVMIYALHCGFGHYYVEGVGYSTIQSIMTGSLGSMGGLLVLLFAAKVAATSISLGSGSSGGVFSPSLFMGATLGGAFAGILSLAFPTLHINVPSFAIVGMGAMVGGGTGAAMTAVTMIFEMTRDYEIVLPMILAVAASIGIRRILSPESIYTMKLVRRGRVMPRALHANLFLVRRARDIMLQDYSIEPSATKLVEFLRRPGHQGGTRHVVVEDGGRIVGVLRINTGVRLAIANVNDTVTLGDVAQRNFTLVRANDTGLDVIRRLWRRNAFMAVVVDHAEHLPRVGNVVGMITKEHVADAVASNLHLYPR